MQRLLITGAAGFIGVNLALHMKENTNLVLLDDFSREGSRRNAEILKDHNLQVYDVDIADTQALKRFLDSQGPFSSLVHLAAQTSLLESIKDPKRDFDTNALGTLNILEYLRKLSPDCKGIFMASNKVYGNLRELDYVELETRYEATAFRNGFDESFPIMPEGGYSISKSISDYYVKEYGARFSMPIISLRQSAVYGPNQNPRSDQGWIAFFTEQYLLDSPVVLRGVGKQVRDVLYIDDFVSLIENLLDREPPYGESFNVGGGPDFSLSILELFEILESIGGRPVKFKTGVMALEDQMYFTSNNRKISALTKWSPTISPRAGVLKLYESILATQ